MKTPILRKYETKLVEVNDQLCYFLFSDAEVEAHLDKTTAESGEAFTTNIFPDNRFSERLHIKVSALPLFRKQAFHTTAGVSLIAAVEYMLYYIEEIERYRAKVLPSVHDSLHSNKPEEQLENKLKEWSGKAPNNAIIKTIKYLRLRRNHIAHLNDEMSQDFKSLIRNDATQLNNYWKSRETEIYDFDFAKTDFSLFSESESLALINLTRVCLKIIDEIILSTIEPTIIAQYEIIEFLKKKSINGLTDSKKSSKFRGMLVSKYGSGIGCTDEEFEAYAKVLSKKIDSEH